jgi:threonine/homoserine/homoserine lactone efflux protein
VTALLDATGLGSAQQALLFALAVLALNATPGVDLLLTLTRTLQGGARAGLAAAAGICAGCLVHALAAAAGLAALLALHGGALQAVQVLGAAYLVWLAAGLLREALSRDAAVAPDDRPPRPRPWQADLRQGLVTNLLNPKVALFFLAFLPQFLQPQASGRSLAMALLGLWFVLQSALFLALVVLAARPLRQVRWPPAVRRIAQGVAGVLFIGLALRLALAPVSGRSSHGF